MIWGTPICGSPAMPQVRDLPGCPALAGSRHCSAGRLSAVQAAVQLGGTRWGCSQLKLGAMENVGIWLINGGFHEFMGVLQRWHLLVGGNSRFPEMGVPPKSSICRWDFPIETIQNPAIGGTCIESTKLMIIYVRMMLWMWIYWLIQDGWLMILRYCTTCTNRTNDLTLGCPNPERGWSFDWSFCWRDRFWSGTSWEISKNGVDAVDEWKFWSLHLDS